MKLARRAPWFLVAGGIGFAVDAVVMSALLPQMGPIPAQILGFAFASLTTWWVNRRFTFADRQAGHTGATSARYVTSALISTLAVNGLFAVGVHSGASPLAALVGAAVISAVLSYLILDLWVFRDRSSGVPIKD